MKTQRITVRLPAHIISSIDIFVKLGEYSCRSDAIRQGLSKLIEENADRVIQKAQKFEKLSKLEKLAESLKEYNKE